MIRSMTSARGRQERESLIQAIGADVSRFQESSKAFDDVAAEILAIDRSDLPCMTLLLFGGPATVDELAARLQAPRRQMAVTVERLLLAGYARHQPDGRAIDLTSHARRWIERIWAPLQQEGRRMLEPLPTRDLRLISRFLSAACAVQEKRTARLRGWLALPSRAGRPHLRGGLAPAALRRVQLFVEANLGRPIRLADLAARAGLSPYHFARAFRTSTGTTPRAYVEARRVERAKQLLKEGELPIAAIAVETGFGTQSRFTTIFRRLTGFTPAAYRRGSVSPESRGRATAAGVPA